jgi:hypothetical protein
MEYFIVEETAREMDNKFNGQEVVEVEVTSAGDFIRHLVRAKIAKSLNALPGADKLWVRGDGSGLPVNKEPWGIQILEEMKEE